MRKVKIFMFLFMIFYIYSCSLSHISATEKNKPSLKNANSVDKYGIVKGVVNIDSKNVYIISNYKSRSRIDYKVFGSLKNKIARFNGRVIGVEGKITRIGWSGSVFAEKIISIKSKNNRPVYHITITGIADLQGFLDSSKKYGGIAKIATIIKQITSKNKDGTLTVLSGDDLMGRYFHRFKGRAIYSLLSQSGFEVYALGNHEFDNGDNALAYALKYAEFNVLCSDLYVEGTALQNRCKRYVIRKVGGVKVGVFSLMTEQLSKISSPDKVKVRCNNIYAAKKMVRILKKHGADIILAVTHIGYKQDKIVAASVKGINVIFGGHSHKYLKQADIVNKTIIVNGGERGKYVVKVDVYLNKNKHILPNMTKYKLINVSSSIKQDKDVEIELAKYKKLLPKSVVIGKFDGRVDLRESVLRFRESGFADTVNDILKKKFGVDVVFNNSGLFKGDKIYKNTHITDVILHNIFEYNNMAYTMKLKGRYIKNILEQSVKTYGKGGWLQVAGIKYEINIPLCKKLLSKKQKDLSSCITDITIGGEPIKDDRIYTVLTNDFLARGGNGYVWFEKYGKEKNNTYTTFYSIIAGYIKRNTGIFKSELPDGRIVLLH